MELVVITQEIYESTKRLKKAGYELYELAKEKAVAERDYRKSLALEIMRLRDEGKQATLIPDIARGNVSDLKFNRDLAEVKYQSARDSLRAIEQQLSGLQSILKYQSEV